MREPLLYVDANEVRKQRMIQNSRKSAGFGGILRSRSSVFARGVILPQGVSLLERGGTICGRCVNRKERRKVAALDLCLVKGRSFHSLPLPSLPFTGMITRTACFSLCIFHGVPYKLTSLHVTISTAIRAVDDNQSAN